MMESMTFRERTDEEYNAAVGGAKNNRWAGEPSEAAMARANELLRDGTRIERMDVQEGRIGERPGYRFTLNGKPLSYGRSRRRINEAIETLTAAGLWGEGLTGEPQEAEYRVEIDDDVWPHGRTVGVTGVMARTGEEAIDKAVAETTLVGEYWFTTFRIDRWMGHVTRRVVLVERLEDEAEAEEVAQQADDLMFVAHV